MPVFEAVAQLVTEWSTDDPQLAEMLRMINREPDPAVRLDLEAALHTWQALDCARRAGAIRARRPRGAA